jgi:hypothetical protein
MKNIALSLCLALVLAACSSGNTASDTPPSVTGLYRGAFESSNGLDEGVMILNIVEDEDMSISGTVQFEFTKTDLTCLRPSTINGSIAGFAVALTSDQSGGTLTLQLTFDGTTLTGTYITSGTPCSDFSGSGTITLTR